jgi:CRP/FNR family transcriptional regulator, anaerobic regulatory protein
MLTYFSVPRRDLMQATLCNTCPLTVTDGLEGLDHLDRLFARGFGTDRRTVEAGEPLIRQGENFGSVGAIFTGWVIRSRLLEDGKRQILSVLLPGDAFGLDTIFAPAPEHGVHALTPVTFGVVEDRHVRAVLLSNARFTATLLRRVLEERRALDRLTSLIGRCEAEQRIATFLLGIHARLRRRRLAASASFNLPMTQQQIGDHLGITVVHVNRVLRRFREDGIATMRNHTVVFHDVMALRERARFQNELDLLPAGTA